MILEDLGKVNYRMTAEGCLLYLACSSPMQPVLGEPVMFLWEMFRL